MQFPSIADLGAETLEMERSLPEGTVLSIMPPTREYMRDPMWFSALGRDPIERRRILELDSREEMKEKIAEVLEEWPRYGPAIYEKAAVLGRRDVVEILLELGASCDPKTMKQQDEDEDDEDVPAYAHLIVHPYFQAIEYGHLDIVKLLVEQGGVPVDCVDDEGGFVAVAQSVGPDVEILRWLLDYGATITTVRENGVNDLQAAIQNGSVECARMILENKQAIDAGLAVEVDDLRRAAHSKNVEMVSFVLQSNCFGIENPEEGSAGRGGIGLSKLKIDGIQEAIVNAVARSAIDSIRLLLKQLTLIREDGSFEPLRLPAFIQIPIFNATEDAMELYIDNAELFEVLWDTCLHHGLNSDNDDGAPTIVLPPEEMINRRLMSACATGCPQTAKLLVEKYGADINHISHKFFSTPLGRAAASGAHPYPGRMAAVQYLCSKPDLDMNLSNGEYCNGETALALAVAEAHRGRYSRNPDLAEMVRLLLGLGGPVDEVGADLRQRCDEAGAGDEIDVHVLLGHDAVRKPVRLSAEGDPACAAVVLRYTSTDLRGVLRGIKIRMDNEELQAKDPRVRPLMPAPGEELPDEERVKPTMLAQSAEARLPNIEQPGA